MKCIKTTDAVGHVLCHDITRIVKDVVKDTAFRKGHIVQEEDIEYIEANNAAPGDVKFANLDGSEDGKITADDRTILGYNKENFRMSLSSTLKYKNLELYFLFAGVFGGNGYGLSQNTYAYQTATGTVWDNNLKHGRWTPENRSNKYPRVDYDDSRYTPLQTIGFVRLQD